jgi:hypothetical protein
MSVLPLARFTASGSTLLRPITLSIGLAADCETPTRLRVHAERAWAYAKQLGGNCVIGQAEDTWNGALFLARGFSPAAIMMVSGKRYYP